MERVSDDSAFQVRPPRSHSSLAQKSAPKRQPLLQGSRAAQLCLQTVVSSSQRFERASKKTSGAAKSSGPVLDKPNFSVRFSQSPRPVRLRYMYTYLTRVLLILQPSNQQVVPHLDRFH